MMYQSFVSVDSPCLNGFKGKGWEAICCLLRERELLSVAQQVGGVALAINAKDDAAAQWYRRFSAMPLLDDPLRLVLPLETIAASL